MKKKIGYLGSGAWGICLANLLAENGHDVQMWSIERDVLNHLQMKQEHPKFPGISIEKNLHFTTDLK
jgi:glycerol-3-phosphate dehydrogenase (NAD(P)+)